MAGGMFLIQGEDRLVEMKESFYDSESLIQSLLASYPHLLAGDQMDPSNPRKWLLVKREAGLPSEEGGGARWSVDHLFLDQEGIPTLVEVKRSTDTRIRREVVGQMLDYASNALLYWPVEQIRSYLTNTLQKQGMEELQALEELLGEDADSDHFWQQVRTNLQAGRVRMVFVSDTIPSELQRIVEFLNGQMNPAEILAVEIKQFVGQGMQTLVPRVLGQTTGALQKRSIGGGKPENKWDQDSFFATLSRQSEPGIVQRAREILAWAESRATYIWWGEGRQSGSFVPVFERSGEKHYLFALWTYGNIEFYFQWMQHHPPFDKRGKRQDLLQRLNSIPGVHLPSTCLEKRPSIPLSTLLTPEAFGKLREVFDFFLREIGG